MARVKVLGLNDALHGVVKGLATANWHTFMENKTYQYYFAENSLYVVKDIYTGSITFVKADTPHKAWQNFLAEKVV